MNVYPQPADKGGVSERKRALNHKRKKKQEERNALAMRFMFCTAAVRKDCPNMLRMLGIRA